MPPASRGSRGEDARGDEAEGDESHQQVERHRPQNSLSKEPVSLADTLVAGNYTGGQSSPQDVCDPEVVVMNIAALNALHIVTATGLQTVVPASSPYCYNLPCPAQIQEAKVENCNRAKKLAELLELAEKL